MQSAPIFSLPDKLAIYCCFFLEYTNRGDLARTCHHFAGLMRNKNLLPTVLDTDVCSAVPHYLDKFMRSPDRRLSVEKFILGHADICGSGSSFTRDQRDSELAGRYIDVGKVLRNCPNIRHLCIPSCRHGDMLVTTAGSRGSFAGILQLETNGVGVHYLLHMLTREFPNLHRYSIPLNADIEFLWQQRRMLPPSEITLVSTESVLAGAGLRSLDRWTACPGLKILNLHRPGWSTTLLELKMLVERLFCRPDGINASGILELRIWDLSDPTRCTDAWMDFLDGHPTVSVYSFDVSGQYDNRPCAGLCCGVSRGIRYPPAVKDCSCSWR